MSIALGSFRFETPVILAPMSGVTDLPFRRHVGRFGADFMVTEMVASRTDLARTARSSLRRQRHGARGPHVVQLAGCDPDIMALAARREQDEGADVIDINMGCPVKKVVSGEAGSALMRDEVLAARIIEATVRAVSVPVTLKIRSGWDRSSRNAASIARIAENAGVRMLTVHGRTRCQFFKGRADWDFIGEVKRAVAIPVIANGDVVSVDDAAETLRRSGADGVMIGRGSAGRPWFLRQVKAFLSSGMRLAAPDLAEQRHLALAHYEAMLTHYGTEQGSRVARKHLNWYLEGLGLDRAARQQVLRAATAADTRSAVRICYDTAAMAAAA